MIRVTDDPCGARMLYIVYFYTVYSSTPFKIGVVRGRTALRAPTMKRIGRGAGAALLTLVVAAGMASIFFAALVTNLPEQHTEVGSLGGFDSLGALSVPDSGWAPHRLD